MPACTGQSERARGFGVKRDVSGCLGSREKHNYNKRCTGTVVELLANSSTRSRPPMTRAGGWGVIPISPLVH